jgi:hypothetical protein
MRTGETVTLPKAFQDYDFSNELMLRRTIEQHFQDLRNDVIDNRDFNDKSASLSQRRQQFLLMGA